VSRTTGHGWSRGYKTYRRGQVTGFVPPLERLAVRQVSARFLSQDERIEIADLQRAGLGVRRIADRMGRAPSTISHELRRNAAPGGGYRPFEAHRLATARRGRRHRRRIETSNELRELITELLAQRWSPQQISRHLRLRFPGQPGMWLCHESIYQAVYQPGSVLLRPSPLARTAVPRCAPDGITGGRISAPSAAGPGSSSRCGRSTSGLSSPVTARRPGTGRAISSSAGKKGPRSARWSSGRPGWSGSCTCGSATPRPCTMR
jgi:Helix-turn-helix domain